jgi:hypothetical protein
LLRPKKLDFAAGSSIDFLLMSKEVDVKLVKEMER